jgi:hypothetical protein
MVRRKKAHTAESAGTLQQAVEDGIAGLFVVFLERQISNKLKEQLTNPPKTLARKLADHVLSQTEKPFVWKGRSLGKDFHLVIDKSDLDLALKEFERFRDDKLPDLISSMAENASQRILRSLKARWADEERQQELDLAGFRDRLHARWREPLGKLRMLITMAREWCGEAHAREHLKRGNQSSRSRKLLIRLLTRGLQVSDEILCLLENGFADGAMARWRTLHEIAVVAAVIRLYGDEVAGRYIDHQHVESKRSMSKYLESAPQLGYRKLSLRAQRRIQRNYDKVIATYGDDFRSDYGWAAAHLKKKRPTFADLEKAAGRAKMRSHYQMGNDNIHAGVKSMYFRLGLMGNYEALLSGRSNVGLTEPGQNAAHTLTQLAVIACSAEPTVDDNVISMMLLKLRDEIPRCFARMELRIQRDEKTLKR